MPLDLALNHLLHQRRLKCKPKQNRHQRRHPTPIVLHQTTIPLPISLGVRMVSIEVLAGIVKRLLIQRVYQGVRMVSIEVLAGIVRRLRRPIL